LRLPEVGVAFSVKKFNDVFMIELTPIVFFVDACVVKQKSFHCNLLSTPDTLIAISDTSHSQYLVGVANDFHPEVDALVRKCWKLCEEICIVIIHFTLAVFRYNKITI
jgi:hypothetical protein